MEPDYLICLNCESPCYSFEWQEGGVAEAYCDACGDDDPDGFMSEEDFDGMVAAGEHG